MTASPVDIVLRLMNETGRSPLEIAWFYRKLTDRGLSHDEAVRETERAARAPGPMTLPEPATDAFATARTNSNCPESPDSSI